MPARDSTAAPLRLAQRAWRELNKDSARAIALADQALARAGLDAAAEGWARLYWMTKADNAEARRLYDRFTLADDFVRYVIRQR